VSERIERLARLIRMKRENLLYLKTYYGQELSRGDMIETLCPEGDTRACFFDVGDVLPSVG